MTIATSSTHGSGKLGEAYSFGSTVFLTTSGNTAARAARTFGISRQAIDSWLVAFFGEGGDAALAAKKLGRPNARIIPEKHHTKIVKALQGARPDQLKLPFALCTREAVVGLIKKHTRRTVAVWTAGGELKYRDFTPQKPRSAGLRAGFGRCGSVTRLGSV
jgi:hypothetical protein